MRFSFPYIVALLVLSFGIYADAQADASNAFITNLSLGSRSMQVTALQQILNRDPDTRIADTGPGSAGYETNYFGTKTLDAVRRFQNKYKNEVLTPAGLSMPTGYVGFFSLKKLRALESEKQQTAPQNTTPTASVATTTAIGAPNPTPLYLNMPVPAGVNPNTINLDYEIALVTKVGKEQGVSDEKIQQEIQNIRNIVATTTNLSNTFFSRIAAAAQTPGPTLSFADEVNNSFGTAFLKIFSLLGLGPIERARAATASVPFGGHIVFIYPCTCTAGEVWRVTIAPPLPPSYATLLDAPVGEQLFASYNSPLVGIYELGFYMPGAPSCIMYYGVTCAPNVIPGWGTILPFVGSSPL